MCMYIHSMLLLTLNCDLPIPPGPQEALESNARRVAALLDRIEVLQVRLKAAETLGDPVKNG